MLCYGYPTVVIKGLCNKNIDNKVKPVLRDLPMTTQKWSLNTSGTTVETIYTQIETVGNKTPKAWSLHKRWPLIQMVSKHRLVYILKYLSTVCKTWLM